MGRKLRTTLPITADQLKPRVPNVNFDGCYRTKNLQPLQAGDTVWIPKINQEEESHTRSYTVQMEQETFRHLDT